jgi:hypothetical protein
VERVELDVPGPMVRVEWDRGHDVFTGIVRAADDAGIILTPIHDNVPLAGLRWIDDRELLRVVELRPDDPAVRLADLTDARVWAVERSLTDLRVLLASLQHDGDLVMVQQAATGSRTGRVGRITSVDAQRVVLRDVSTSARWSGDTDVIDLDDVICVEWGNAYLRSLATLLEAESTGWIPPG